MGRQQTQETRDKISKSRKALFQGSPELKEKNSEMMKARYKNGFNPNLGKKRSAETRLKMSMSHMGHVQSEESKTKMSLARKWEKHWNWSGGWKRNAWKIIRRSCEYKKWRLSVFTRDKYICQECWNTHCELNADHIKPFAYFPELRFSIDNWRTLCLDCHRKTDTWWLRWRKLYYNLI